eukprot:TRINITY_DN18696_c0_g2_i2.p1 TRINITY_DN18696_c0_g2~~TRINITY_DN18696_c0_g2_i2.p1  ORF type:complete len:433 (+),score=68.65 TRINITY_DN18696_c0_g2_i2:162-1301(+)
MLRSLVGSEMCIRDRDWTANQNMLIAHGLMPKLQARMLDPVCDQEVWREIASLLANVQQGSYGRNNAFVETRVVLLCLQLVRQGDDPRLDAAFEVLNQSVYGSRCPVSHRRALLKDAHILGALVAIANGSVDVLRYGVGSRIAAIDTLSGLTHTKGSCLDMMDAGVIEACSSLVELEVPEWEEALKSVCHFFRSLVQDRPSPVPSEPPGRRYSHELMERVHAKAFESGLMHLIWQLLQNLTGCTAHDSSAGRQVFDDLRVNQSNFSLRYFVAGLNHIAKSVASTQILLAQPDMLHGSVRCCEILLAQYRVAVSERSREIAEKTTASSKVPWGVQYGGYCAVRWLMRLEEQGFESEVVVGLLESAPEPLKDARLDGMDDT